MRIFTFSSGPFETKAYLYATPEGEKEGECFLIDAPPDSYPLIAETLKDNNLTLTYLLLTHSHWDHTACAALFKRTFPTIKLGAHLEDVGNLEKPGSDGLPSWLPLEAVKPDFLFKEGDRIGPLEVIETPGHTPGSVVFYDAKEKVLFSGDTLFKGTIGNLSFPTARPEMMWHSLAKLAKLPTEVKIFPGHGESTTLAKEKWLPRAKEIFG